MRIHQLGRLSVLSILLASCFTTQAANAADTLLLRQPTVSRDHLAFVYAGDIWLADRDGQHPV